jgi:hypothetical protein
MKNLGKIVGTNLLILLIYSIISKVFGDIPRPKNYNPRFVYIPAGMVWMAYIIVFHTVICLGIGIKKFAESKKKEGAIYLLTCLLVLVIGFGTCTQLGAVKNIQVEEKSK